MRSLTLLSVSLWFLVTINNSQSYDRYRHNVEWVKAPFGKEYYYLPLRFNFYRAHYACDSIYGHLPKIESKEEQDWIIKNFKFTRWCPFFWIGAKAERIQTDFAWTVDATPLNWTNWDAGQPDEPKTFQSCNAIKIYVGDGKWQDEPCYNTYSHVICERNK